MTARRKLYNAGVELLECDHVYAEGIKAELERHTFADYMVPFEGDTAEKKQIDEADVRFYLEMRMRIYACSLKFVIVSLHSFKVCVYLEQIVQ